MHMPATLLSYVNNRYLLRKIFLLLSITSFSTLATAEKISDAVSEATAAAGTWTSVKAMSHPRLSIKAAPVPMAGNFNSVLVFGGISQNGIPQMFGKYDFNSDTWLNFGPAQSLLRHTATLLLPNAGGNPFTTALVSGGTTEKGGRLNEAYLVYSNHSASWAHTGRMVFKRDQHVATLLRDGRVLISGGWGTATLMNTAELYHPTPSVWTQTGSMREARLNHTATLLPDGRVLVAGGFNHSSYMNTAELYDPDTGTWAQAGTMNAARGSHTATLLPNGKILVTGGYGTSDKTLGKALNTTEIYDPRSDTWTQVRTMNSHRAQHTATSLSDGNVLVAGGLNDSSEVLKTAELYDPSNDLWISTESMKEARYQHAAAKRDDGTVFIVGGLGDVSGADILATAEVYTP